MEHFKEAAKEAEKVMRGVFERTPLQKNEHLSAIYGADIWLKREDLSPVRSYKLRGAFNAMRKQEKNKLFLFRLIRLFMLANKHHRHPLKSILNSLI